MLPRVFTSGVIATDSGDLTGGGSGQSSTDVWMVDFEDWCTLFAEDLNGDGLYDETDYAWWFYKYFENDQYFDDYVAIYFGGTKPVDPRPQP